ncbi:adaptor protein family protein [Entamoeba histolytica HM-1:IMSS-B]|uniref:AP-1 complex subunit gamma n=7 Tax=Entamoeba histolytica TaxID=5759 RepID=A0A8U0WP03_ENTH1|nr:adaptor protein (AP) family protein [Entamoeba histolytica HM-1:IMSS]EMD44669.1 adaptin alpha/gamma/epsilon, putative [Entamoeba histolytica KU27]EMH77425.1 adaptor protein family protein [Entamoeba histolytica HM-1:IMSS-B]EMS13213.1 adaptin, alpha/gamma/epsilon, putative [Entamoeba histolytica HM-3:IMSS]ENY61578.1 adaptin, alpha/gamma/epsilon, putative [Entamoeba histolytica HM-1:IMSS-A]BAE94786.1 gamma subunit isoform 2 [Entamoeba histolytica]|eukprot:XP_649909.1 adaptor protein (AP) family protein [Entamoeba histolytica HM-1:IMSS]
MKSFKEPPKHSIKLRELIERVKACKTIEEEKILITRECADIRSTMPENQYKTRNVMKLIYLDLLGYNTQFAQIECLALISSHEFQTKRIGYLALGLLLDENQETLTLIINHLQKDLESDNQNIVELALTTIANIGSEELCQVISPHVLKVFNSRIRNVQKKAIAAALRIIKKCPNLIDQYINPVIGFLNKSENDFILPITKLIISIITHPSFQHAFDSCIPILISILNKNTRGNGFDVSLQACICCNILDLLKKIYTKKYIFDIEDVLSDIIINSPKNSIGICVGFAAAQCALEIECDSLVKEMGINYIIRLIYDEYPNTRYAAFRYIELRTESIWKFLIPFTSRILDCLEDEDEGIKLFALHISAQLAQYGSQKEIVHHIITSLGEGEKYTKEASKVVCDLVELVDAEAQWKFDCLLNTAMESDKYINENITQRLINIISLNDIQTYAVTKLFPLMRSASQPIKKAAVWCVGEYFDLLKNVVKEDIIINEVIRCNCEELIRITALAKIAAREGEKERSNIGKLLVQFKGGHSFEENQRYNEAIAVCNKGTYVNGWKRMPAIEEVTEFGHDSSNTSITLKKLDKKEQLNIIEEDKIQQTPLEGQLPSLQNNFTSTTTTTLLDFNNGKEGKRSDVLFNQSTNLQNNNSSLNDILGFVPTTQIKPSKYDILGSLENDQKNQQQQSVAPLMFDLIGNDSIINSESKNENQFIEPQQSIVSDEKKENTQINNNENDDFEFTEYIPSAPVEKIIDVCQDTFLHIQFKIKKNGDECTVVTVFKNTGNENIKNIVLKVAAPKTIHVDVQCIEKEVINPQEESTQLFTTKGQVNGNVPVKIRVEYLKGTEQKVLQSTPVILNQ